ncbi:MAG: YchJ family metal-binding protein [Propionibacteriaceae bacterium]|nr:YchJ family metal-binding protein [Propionibacteriaceae bacterium]
MPEACPCDTGKPYAACCGALHDGRRVAATAVQLMRSRYAAFALGLSDYLVQTWHPSTRPGSVDIDPAMTWTGLEIEATTKGSAWEDDGTVRFAASWTSGRHHGVLRETSQFALVDGRWVYVNGIVHR